jgi:hypothetical protein
MRTRSIVVAALAALLTSTCAKRVPEPTGVAPGALHISWVIMSGDSDNPDQEFVCQSDPRNDCVLPVSRPDAQVFSNVHFYYHGAGPETKYAGSIDVGFLQGTPDSHKIQANATVPKNETITNHSVSGIVTATPGSYPVTFAFVATITDSGESQPIRENVAVVVK